MRNRPQWAVLTTAGILSLAACTNTSPSGDAGTPTSDAGRELPSTFFPPQPLAFTSTTDAPGTIQVSASGEALAQTGYVYAATPGPDEPSFVDGWTVRFTKYLAVIERVRVNQPGADPDQRAVLGPEVASQRGPWIVDLVPEGPLVGAAGAPETAWPLTVIPGAGLSATTRYAFSYDVGRATADARNVNVPAADRALVEQMITRGWSKYLEGVATYAGASPMGAFTDYPRAVTFRFGFYDGARYVNCHNPELGADDVAANRGVQPRAGGAQRAQLTFHTDHFFWDQAEVEGTPLRFDALAARADGSSTVTMDDLAGVPVSALVDRMNRPVTDRGSMTTGYVRSGGAPPAYAANGVLEITDLRSFVAYNHRGQGHLNSDGLCLVEPTGALAF